MADITLNIDENMHIYMYACYNHIYLYFDGTYVYICMHVIYAWHCKTASRADGSTNLAQFRLAQTENLYRPTPIIHFSLRGCLSTEAIAAGRAEAK